METKITLVFNSNYTIIRCKKILNKHAGGILKPRLKLYFKTVIIIIQMKWRNQQAFKWGYPGEGIEKQIPKHNYTFSPLFL